MTDATSWLPELLALSDCDGDWGKYLATIYEVFCRDFIQSTPSYPGKRFAMKRHPMARGKEATFWHLIQEGPVEEERIPDFRRCERIRWPRPIIEAIQSGHVRVWKNTRGRNERIIIAVSNYSYVVILDERDDFVLLWTAYYVERDHQRKKLAKEHAEWQKAQPSNS